METATVFIDWWLGAGNVHNKWPYKIVEVFAGLLEGFFASDAGLTSCSFAGDLIVAGDDSGIIHMLSLPKACLAKQSPQESWIGLSSFSAENLVPGSWNKLVSLASWIYMQQVMNFVWWFGPAHSNGFTAHDCKLYTWLLFWKISLYVFVVRRLKPFSMNKYYPLFSIMTDLIYSQICELKSLAFLNVDHVMWLYLFQNWWRVLNWDILHLSTDCYTWGPEINKLIRV